MKRTTRFSLLAAVILVFGCSTATNNETSETAEAEPTEEKDVTQLTYQDVVAMVYDDDGEGLEWHGEEMPNELTGFLSIDSGEPCATGNCGNELTLTNTAEKTITVIVKGDYNIEGDMGYIPRKYTVDAGQTARIGCSHLCYGEGSYAFTRAIVGSEYAE